MNEIILKKYFSINILSLFFFIVLCIQLMVGLVIYFSFSSWNERADFGAMFVFVDTLFSGLAFVGLIYALFLQQQELTLNRKELSLSRNEIARSAQAQENTEKIFTEQLKLTHFNSQLTAINNLIEFYESELKDITNFSPGSAAEKRREAIIDKKNLLTNKLEDLVLKIDNQDEAQLL